MATLVVGFDEFIGAHVTDILLNRGEQVLGASLETDDTEQQTIRKQQLLNHNNAHHLKDMGMFNVLSFSAPSLHQPISKVIFLPNFSFIANSKAQLLADTLTLIALCKQIKPIHMVVGSHHSIYYPHGHSQMDCQESLNHPIDLEAATCRSMELLFHGLSASNLIPCTVVRIFDCYGLNADSNNVVSLIINHLVTTTDQETLTLDNDTRDFSYVGDIAEGLCRILDHTALPSPEWDEDTERADISEFPYAVYNLGSGIGTTLSTLQHMLRQLLKHARSTGIELQANSRLIVADVQKLQHQIGFAPETPLQQGLSNLLQQLTESESD